MKRDPATSEPCSLRSPLSVAEAARAVESLGPAALLPKDHPDVVALDVPLNGDPFGPHLTLRIESRPYGCRVTAEPVPSAFLRDFMHVVKRAITILAALACVAVAIEAPAPGRGAALAAVAVGWAGLFGLVSFLHAEIDEHGAHAARAHRNWVARLRALV